MKKISFHNVSVRHKFKDPETIELVIMDQTDAIQITYLIRWREDLIKSEVTKKSEKKENEITEVSSTQDVHSEMEEETDDATEQEVVKDD